MLKTNVRKYDNFKLYYWHDATLVGEYRLPQLAPTQAIPTKVISFNERKGVTDPDKYWVDFFIDDDLFENFWNHPDMSFSNLKRFAGIITTDYSMLPELLPGQNIWNCTRNRVMAYYLQQQGFNIIPVASWCFESDFEWCFDGLPEKSSIAISTNGCVSSPYGRRILLQGVEELQKQKEPTNLIVCGRHVPEFDIYDIQDLLASLGTGFGSAKLTLFLSESLCILAEHISDGGLTPATDIKLSLTAYRGGSHLPSDIYYYPCFSKRWEERTRNGK